MAKTEIKTIDEAWLGLDSVETDFFNPMSILNVHDDDFNMKLAWLMTRPEYLSFITTWNVAIVIMTFGCVSLIIKIIFYYIKKRKLTVSEKSNK